jgi:hypothetical protein
MTLLVLFFINITISFDFPFGDIYGGGTSLLFFIFLFLVGAYIRLYDIKWKKCQFGRYFFVLSLFVFCYTLAQELVIGHKHQVFLYHIFNSYNSLIFFLSLFAFLWFKNVEFRMKETRAAFIFKLSPLVFGVYLISDHPLMRQWLWGQVDWNYFFSSFFFIPFSFTAILIVFVVCLLIDYVRFLLFKLLRIDNYISRFCGFVQSYPIRFLEK